MQTTVKGRFIGGALYSPKESQSGEKFSACVVLEPGEEEKIRGIRALAMEEEFGNKAPKGLKDWTLRKGDDEEYEHSFGKLFINPKSKAEKKPPVMRRVAGVLEPCEDIYPGCYVHVSVNAYAYSGDAKKSIEPGVSLGLRAVMFWKDGDRIGGGFSNEEFEGFESDGFDESFDFGVTEQTSKSSLL